MADERQRCELPAGHSGDHHDGILPWTNATDGRPEPERAQRTEARPPADATSGAPFDAEVPPAAPAPTIGTLIGGLIDDAARPTLYACTCGVRARGREKAQRHATEAAAAETNPLRLHVMYAKEGDFSAVYPERLTGPEMAIGDALAAEVPWMDGQWSEPPPADVEVAAELLSDSARELERADRATHKANARANVAQARVTELEAEVQRLVRERDAATEAAEAARLELEQVRRDRHTGTCAALGPIGRKLPGMHKASAAGIRALAHAREAWRMEDAPRPRQRLELALAVLLDGELRDGRQLAAEVLGHGLVDADRCKLFKAIGLAEVLP